MSLANLFVELVVTGFHTLIWISVIVVTISGYQNIDWVKFATLNLAFPFVALAYIIGIVVDKLVDSLFRSRDYTMRKDYLTQKGFQELPSLLSMRYKILLNSSDLYEQLEYIRSRMRIARTAVINFFLTTLTVLVFVRIRLQDIINSDYHLWVYFGIILTGLFLTLSSYVAWSELNKTYIASTVNAFQVLKSERELKNADKTTNSLNVKKREKK